MSSPCSLPVITEKETIRYCRKIRIYPTKEQKKLFEQCFGATRFVWNRALEYIEQHPTVPKTHYALREHTLLKDFHFDQEEYKEYAWLKAVPYDTRDLVLKQLASNFKTNFTLLRQKHIKYFKMKFKAKRNPYQVFYLTKASLDLQHCRIFKTRLKEPFKVRNKVRRWIEHQTSEGENQIVREKNRYYLCLPRTPKSHEETNYRFTPQIYNRVALDPGVRTFQTFYSDQGIAGKIGDSLCETLIDLGLKEDRLKSKLQTVKKKRTRYNMKKRCFLLRTKIKNIVKDLHWKTCHYLCSMFKHILLPSFNVSKMIVKHLPERARRIHSKTVRNMLSLSHYAFKQRLLYKAKVEGCQVDIVNEAYTTKTCGHCGALKEMNGLKVYRCPCGFVLDRDYNAARNIFLKYL